MLRSLQRRLRGPMRPVVRYLLYFINSTHYVEGSGGSLTIGERVGLANTYCNLSSGSITIGDRCIFGPNVMLITGRHTFTRGRRASLWVQDQDLGWGGGSLEVPTSGYDIVIGEGTWICAGAIVSGGVAIGSHAIVAAGAVVTRDVPDHAIVAGVPARVIGDTREQ